MVTMALRLLLLGTIFVVTKASSGDVGLIRADLRGSKQSEHKEVFCISYTPEFNVLQVTYKDQPSSLLADYSGHDGCDNVYTNITGQVVAIARGNCTFTHKASIIQSRGGVAAIIVNYSNKTSLVPPGGNSTDYNSVNITVATILYRDFHDLLKLGRGVRVWLYSPPPPHTDPNIILMFGLATLCVMTGACLSAIHHHRRKQRRGSCDGKDEDEEDEDEKKTLSLGMGILMSVAMVVFFCVSLTLLYFFYDYLVYAIMAIFGLAGVNGLFQALVPLWQRLVPWDARVPVARVPCLARPPQVRSLLLLLVCSGFVAVWVVFRHESYAWILQDIIGFCFCLYVMRALLMPSLRACTVLLSLLFIYDIFFVFITPLFTKDGESVMIKVATGGNSKTGEQMPMVFKVPYFLPWAMSQCFTDKYSLLGYGDVIVPGLLLTYNCAFDLRTQHTSPGRWRLLYFTASSLAYMVGLILTGGALYIMKSGQPALLYLVPCTVLTTVVIAALRKELGHMWRGQQCPKKNDDLTAPVPTSGPTVARVDCQGDDDNNGEMTTERQSLIQ